MNLAFYYHIPIIKKGDELYCPGFLGVFLDSIALEVNKLVLIMHESKHGTDSDYMLKQKNISFISLGKKTSAWERMLFHKSILKNKLVSIDDCNLLLVRSPSPLAPYFKQYLKNTKLVYWVVGDYQEGAKLMKISSPRDLFIKAYLMIHNYIFLNQLKTVHTLVNSKFLFKKLKKICQKIDLVKTTTLSKKDFFYRDDTCLNEKVNLLYTGRINWEKGLLELIHAFSELKKSRNQLHLNIVGWENNPKKPVEKELRKITLELNISDGVTFHGFKAIGDELNEMYQMADIYVLPSYHEGFPRTIWEAMANSLPVIATTVGSIPFDLIDGQDAILINPKSILEIKMAISKIIINSDLRKRMIQNGRNKAIENTLEIQNKRLISTINHE
tara:strand:- start:4489 stop:5646 length:1158 start_codon:yes stop_codon:yes gene_type:complete